MRLGAMVGDGSSSKLAGKTLWAGRRRPTTRRSGFRANSPGSDFEIYTVAGFQLAEGEELQLTFTFPAHPSGSILGYGGWVSTTQPVTIGIEGSSADHHVLVPAVAPDWGKFGSQWRSTGREAPPITVRITAAGETTVAFWGLGCGVVEHDYLRDARPALMRNMYSIAPEANFISPERQGHVSISTGTAPIREVPFGAPLYAKSCNRCGRFLPVNIPNERLHLSFTNHCCAAHRLPCSHNSFGRLTNTADGSVVHLLHGFQLECRFCKKFEVNAAHNPQRTSAQMKEDGARRRAFEILLEQLYQGSSQLSFPRTDTELADAVWSRFGQRCFKCGTPLATPRDMHLDHTRPLAMLWPLDETATALCATHNSDKRDRSPSEYYTVNELERLSTITGIPLAELEDPSPNMKAIRLLGKNLDWFHDEFLQLPALTREHDGKIPADLLVKALRRTLTKCPGGPPFTI
jgi:hypothetical protein